MSDTDDLRALDASMAAAINGKNVEAAVACYTPDAALMPPGNPLMKGHDAIRMYWKAAMDAGLGDVAINAHMISVSGDEATVAGTLSGTAGDRSLSGKYILYCRRTGDGWKMHCDIWNFDD